MEPSRPVWATVENLYGRYPQADSSDRVLGIAWYVAETYNLPLKLRTKKRGDASVTYVTKGSGRRASWVYAKGLGADEWYVEQDRSGSTVGRYLLYRHPHNRVKVLDGLKPN